MKINLFYVEFGLLSTCFLVLFGSLMWTAFSGNVVPFIFGYPASVVLMVLAWIVRVKRFRR